MDSNQASPGSPEQRAARVRGGALAAGCALLIAVGLAVHADNQGTTPKPVTTARPPPVAVPASPLTAQQQVRMRQCRATAKSKGLHGAELGKYLRGCIAPRHTMTAGPASAAAHVAPAAPATSARSPAPASPASR